MVRRVLSRSSIVAGERGQAAVELVALLPLVAALAMLLWQAIVAGQAVWLAGSAARAAARAGAVGEDVRAAALRVLPDRLDRGLVVERMRSAEGDVRVSLRIPAVAVGWRLGTVSARAALQDQTR